MAKQSTKDLFSSLDMPAASSKKASVPAAKSVVVKEVSSSGDSYTAKDIEVLEGLEPVRRRPGMYIGGTDEKALHHLFAEVIDNSMDEAVAGHATFIEVQLDADGYLTVSDNGRGIPIDPHPKFPKKSALEVIMTTLHSGGKFDSKAYQTSGGLHGVGVSVVNALSEHLEVEVARGQKLYRQTFSRGAPQGGLQHVGAAPNRRGTRVKFKPDAQIFGSRKFIPARLFRMARSKAYLFGGVEIRWSCDPSLLVADDPTPAKETFHFPGGLAEYLNAMITGQTRVVPDMFMGRLKKDGGHGSLEWAVAFVAVEDGFCHSYCNTITTPEGGTHEAGLRTALYRGLKQYAELKGAQKKFANVTTDDVMTVAACMLSVFIREPEFVGQTKDKLATAEAARIVEQALRDPLDHWLAENPSRADKLVDFLQERADERLRRRQEKDVARKSAVKKLRLPGKLADCTQAGKKSSEIFIVEGDSAGGSAKQARDRNIQAVLPLRGKILNVASAGSFKLQQNQQLADLLLALGCGTGSHYRDDDLRYEKVIIMTDADVDGAHIASLLMTFFYRQLPKLIDHGHLYLAVPPLFRISQGAKTVYARTDAEKDKIVAQLSKGKGKVEVGRFKGLGEMMPQQLKETTMDPKRRTLLRVMIHREEAEETAASVEQLMGTKPEARFTFIQERAAFAENLDLDL